MLREGVFAMLAPYLDSTNLKPDSTAGDIVMLCEQAAFYSMAAVCVNPYRLPLARAVLAGSPVKACTVIGFPLGANAVSTKRQEAEWALRNGAAELDMVINLGTLKDQQFGALIEELDQIMELKRQWPFILKVIAETGLLDRGELLRLLELLEARGVDFIKTSTGINCRGASLEDIQTICRHRRNIKIKASGGIKTLAWARELISAGADRIGSSNAVSLVLEESAGRESF